MRTVCLLLLALVVDHATAMRIGAQEPEQVPGEVTCAECVITLDTVVTIGGLDGPGLNVVSMFSSVAVDRKGRILVWEGGEAEISVFDSTGRYLRTAGRRGEGPGEYRSISHIGVGPRYIHVFEYHEGRTMLDHDFQVVRIDRFPGQILSAAVVSDDVVVFVADVPTPASVGHQLHILRPSGEMASYGHDGEVYSSDLTPWATTRTAVAGEDNTVWAVPLEVNRLVRWDLAPEPNVGRIFDRRVAEFDEGGDAFAPARLGSAMLDDRGLWLSWHTADPDWTGPPPSLDSRVPTPNRPIA
ncbi:MAG: 6-bladed beta-propeller [Gemmatimonadota bacterium]|nr:6-bladed beta-propeller [Gemmatimonadota bacterium]